MSAMFWAIGTVLLLLVIAVFCALTYQEEREETEEVLGDMVDIKQFFKQWEEE